MSEQHTAGPWVYTLGDEHNPFNGFVRDASGNLLVLRATITAEDDSTMRLIAAAPELLAALLALRAIRDGYSTTEATREAASRADAAIAKANT